MNGDQAPVELRKVYLTHFVTDRVRINRAGFLLHSFSLFLGLNIWSTLEEATDLRFGKSYLD